MSAIYIYRIAHFLYQLKIPILPKFLKWIMFVLYNSVIPPECIIGKSSKFVHGGIGVVLHPDAIIGDRVFIGQGVTIGGTFGSKVPRVSNDVWIGPGVRILGEVNVGSNCVIGANSVVTCDVPANCIVGGIPAKKIKDIAEGSLDVLNGSLRNS